MRVISLVLAGVVSVFASDELYRAYSKNAGKNIEAKALPMEFVHRLYGLFVATADKNIAKGSYQEKAWLFENTMAFLGTLTHYRNGSVTYADYKEGVKNLFGFIDSGRLQNFSDADDDGVLDHRLQAYYFAVALGVLAGIGPGFIPYPDKEQGDRYGEVALPVYKYRVSMQQLRVATLTAMTYRVAYNRAELATLYFFANSYCRGVEKQEATRRVATNPSDAAEAKVRAFVCDKAPGVLCYGPIVAAIKDLKVALLAANDAFASQGSSNASFACLSILTQLHNTKVLLDQMELSLYNLSTQYAILSAKEKEMPR